MLIISLFLSIGIYLISRNIITDYITKNQIEIINNVKTIIDKEIETASRIGLKIAFDSNLSQWISNIENREKIFESTLSIQKMLLNYLLTDSIVEEIYLYLYRPNIVFTNNNKYNYKEFNYIIQNNIKLKEHDLSKLLKVRNWGNVYLFKDLNENPVIFILHSIPDPSYREFRGMLIMKLNSNKINNIINNSLNTQKYVIGIIDKNSNYYIISRDNKLVNYIPLKYDFLNRQKNYFELSNKKGENLCVVHFRSNYAQLEYFSLFSLDLVLDKVNHVKNITLFYLFLCIISGIIIAYTLARRSYNPIRRLIDKVSQKIKISESLTENEINFLDKIFENIMEQNKKLESELQDKSSKLVENLFIRLLKENTSYNKGNYKYTQEINNLNVNSNILLIGVSINKIEDKIFKIDENEEEISIVYSIVKNTINDVINSKYKSYVFETDGKILCIMSDFGKSDYDIDEYKSFLKTNLKYVNDFLIKNFGIYTSIAVSRVYSNVRMLSSAYEDINTIFEYLEVSEIDNKIVFFEEIDKKDVYSNRNEILVYLKKMLECITTDNYKNVLEYNDDLVKKIQKYSQINPKITKIYIHTYKNLILNTLINIGLDFNEIDINDILKSVQQTNDINTLKELYKKILETGINLYENNEDKKPYWIDAVIEYVKNNYNLPELCVKVIANKFNISSEHLSRTFRKFVGINLSDFIHTVRLERVKNLLEETNLSIKEIADKTGYLDSKALIRAFKNYIGITPSKYREKNYIRKQI